jgi:hypothetical protein
MDMEFLRSRIAQSETAQMFGSALGMHGVLRIRP